MSEAVAAVAAVAAPSKDLRSVLEDAFTVKELAATTRKQYITKLLYWVEYTGRTLEEIINNPEDAMHELEKSDKMKHTASNHHAYLSAMVAYTKYVLKDDARFDAWKRLEQENWREIEDRYDENRPSELQQDKVATFDEVEEHRQKLEKGSFARLLLSFYTLMEPIRADYFATELIHPGEESKEENYIVLSDYTLKVRDFKMKKKYDCIDNKLSPELIAELEASLEKYPRAYLFTTEDKKSPYPTRKQFSNWACRTLTTALKRPMTLTALRHIYIVHKMSQNTPAKEMVEIAKKMGHSRGMQRVYEWKQ